MTVIRRFSTTRKRRCISISMVASRDHTISTWPSLAVVADFLVAVGETVGAMAIRRVSPALRGRRTVAREPVIQVVAMAVVVPGVRRGAVVAAIDETTCVVIPTPLARRSRPRHIASAPHFPC